MRKAIGFSSRRLAASESSRLANVLVGESRQIITGGLLPALILMSHSPEHILLVVMEAGKYAIWRNSIIMLILDLFIEL